MGVYEENTHRSLHRPGAQEGGGGVASGARTSSLASQTGRLRLNRLMMPGTIQRDRLWTSQDRYAHSPKSRGYDIDGSADG